VAVGFECNVIVDDHAQQLGASAVLNSTVGRCTTKLTGKISGREPTHVTNRPSTAPASNQISQLLQIASRIPI